MDQFLDLIKKFEIEHIIVFLKDALTFYIQPIRFFRNLLQKDRITQAYQISFYFLVNAGILFIVFNVDYRFFIKYFIKDEFTYTIAQAVILSLTIAVVSKFYKTHTSFIESLSKSIVFLTCLNLLTIPIALSFDRAYLNTQEYEYYLANSFLSLFVSVITLIYSGSIFFNNTKTIITYNIVLFLFINIGQVVTSYIDFDTYQAPDNRSNQDEPYTEIVHIKRTLALDRNYPVFELIVRSKDWNDRYYIMKEDMKKDNFDFIPNAKYYINKSRKYIDSINKQKVELDSLKKRAKFDRTIEYINLWQEYFDFLVNETRRDKIKTKNVYVYKYYNINKKQLRDVKLSAVGFDVADLQEKILKYEIQYFSTKRKAEDINNLFYNIYFYPSEFIFSKIED